MNIDPDGRFAFLAVIPFLGGGAATTTAGGLGFGGTGALLGGAVVVATMPGSTPNHNTMNTGGAATSPAPHNKSEEHGALAFMPNPFGPMDDDEY